MKLKPVLAAAIVLTATPAFAAPQWVETACWRHAQRVTPHLTEREKEAYVTNCIADWTAGTPPPHGAARILTATDIDWRFGSRSASTALTACQSHRLLATA